MYQVPATIQQRSKYINTNLDLISNLKMFSVVREARAKKDKEV